MKKIQRYTPSRASLTPVTRKTSRHNALRGCCRPVAQARLLHPETVREAVEHREARGLKGLLGGEQLVPAIGGYRLVGLDPAEPGVLVPQIAETGDQHPFQGGLALLIGYRFFWR